MPLPGDEGRKVDHDEAMLERLRLPDPEPSPLPAKSAKRSRQGFAKMPNEAAVAGYHALGCARALVWHYLHYRVWAEGVPTVPMSNRTLADMGVDRYTKYRALRCLERAGLIRVEHRGHRSPLVTLL
jgi:hypothetical protein